MPSLSVTFFIADVSDMVDPAMSCMMYGTRGHMDNAPLHGDW